MESLRSYLERFITRPSALKGQLRVPVLLLEPTRPEVLREDSSDEYQMSTLSGAGVGIRPDEPLVLPVKKVKDNAFRRGVTVGRTRNNDIVLDDPSVSRFHAWFALDEKIGQWSLSDAGSKNGTRLNGVRLKAKASTPIPEQARVQFGEVALTLYFPVRFWAFLEERARG